MVYAKLLTRTFRISAGRLVAVFAMAAAWIVVSNGSPALADGVLGSGVADFYYFADTGQLFVDTDQQNLVSILVAGPPALSIDHFQDGTFDVVTRSTWVQRYFAGKEQWIAIDDPVAVTGVFQIATYSMAINNSSFGQLEYGTAEGETVFTAMTYRSVTALGDFDFDGLVDVEDYERWSSSI